MVPGELRIKGPGVFPGYLPASGVPDPFELPRNPLGKILKRELRDELRH
jgi:acyl-CoA synthetase (AMP-forming)/AMP-acid ligase II